MNKISELGGMLRKTFQCNKARLDCLTNLLLALLMMRTVNLSELAVGMESEAKVSSRYKRIKRFFQQFVFDYEKIASWIMSLFRLKNKNLSDLFENQSLLQPFLVAKEYTLFYQLI